MIDFLFCVACNEIRLVIFIVDSSDEQLFLLIMIGRIRENYLIISRGTRDSTLVRRKEGPFLFLVENPEAGDHLNDSHRGFQKALLSSLARKEEDLYL